MKSKNFLQLIIFCFSIFGALPTAAATISNTEAKAWAQDKGNLLLDTFQEQNIAQKYQKLDELFLNHVDLEYIAKFVIGKHWKEMSAEQRGRYNDLFTRYALSVYKSFPLTFENKIDFNIISAEVRPDYTDVIASIDLGAPIENQTQQKLSVVFRLVKKGSNIKLIDIKLAESSLILSYRNRFYEMIAKNDGDIEWFLEDLEAITQSTEQTNQQKL